MAKRSSGEFVPVGTAAPAQARARLRPRHVVLGLLLLVLLLLGLWMGRLAVAGWQSLQAAREMRALAAGGIDAGEERALLAAYERAAAGLDVAASDLGRVAPGLHRLHWVPVYGPTLAAAPELAAAANEFAALGGALLPEIAPALATTGGSRLETLAAALAQVQPETVETLVGHAEQAHRALAAVPVTELHPALASRLGPLLPLIESAPGGLRALPSLPVLLGMEQPRTYLVLVQNNQELRPTGGFISAVGRVVMDKGKIASLDFADSYDVFRYGAEYPPAPPPVQLHMAIPYLSFRDSNWSPDLGTTARLARTLYTQDTGQTFDDLFTIDLNAVEAIVAALEPLTIPGVEEPLTGENVYTIIQELYARPPGEDAAELTGDNLGAWWEQRKDFIPLVAQTAVNRIQTGDVDLLRMVGALTTALNQRDIQVLVSEPEAAAAFAAAGWDGSLQPEEGADFLAPVDMNMGYNKVDAVIQRSLAYTVTWPEGSGAPAQAELSLTYTHPLTASDPGCNPAPRYGDSYQDMIERCYFDYVRLFVPAESELETIGGVLEETIVNQRGEKGTQVFAGYTYQPPNSTNTVTFRYRLPPAITPENYRLVLQRQSGTKALPVRLSVNGQNYETLLAAGKLRWQP